MRRHSAALNGATASVSSSLGSGFPAGGVINGDRKGTNWGSGGGWADSTSGTFPDWVEVDFSGSRTINEIDVFTLQDSLSSPSEPTETMTFSTYGLSGFTLFYWDGSAWQPLSGGSVTSNNKVWKKISFTALTTTKIKVQCDAAVDNGYSRLTEVEAWGTAAGGGGGSTSSDIEWLVTDQLGTPRMVFDHTGSLANTKRHDYLPFGEELIANQGLRAGTLGYVSDGVRQQFTSKERDVETGLDYFGARYYASAQGRFDSYDPIFVTLKRLLDPQRLNLYAYARNNPLKFVDPDGQDVALTAKNEEQARKRYNIFLLGLRPEDRKHVHFFAGNGKHGYKSGQFYALVDKDYQSDSRNFQNLQRAANDRTAEGRISVVNPGEKYQMLGLEYRNNREVMPRKEFTFQHDFDGYTLFQYRGKSEEGIQYSIGRYTQSFVDGSQDAVELSATMHHELDAHIVLGDFGRNSQRARHSDAYARGHGTPTSEADIEGERAETEARENAKKKP